MGIFRLLVLAGLAYLVYRVLRNWSINVTPRQPPPAERFEPMARCASCGLYLPAQALSTTNRCGACEKGPR